MAKGSKGGPNDGGGKHGKEYSASNEGKLSRRQKDGQGKFDPKKLKDPGKK